MEMLPPLSRTTFRSPAERLLHGRSPARALDGGPQGAGPQAWAELDASVSISTFERYQGWTSSGTVRVGMHWFDRRETADWSTAPHWHDGHGVTWTATPPAAPELALCLCHADPRVREAALGRAAGRPEVLALVLIRCADTEEPVRERARAVLTAELDAAAAAPDLVRTLAPLALLVSPRRYGAWAWELLLERLGSPPADLIVGLAQDADPGMRFAAVRAALAHGLLPADRVADLTADPDARNRLAALRSGELPADRTARLVLTGQTPEVRREALDLALEAGILTPEQLLETAAASQDRVVRRRCEEAARPALETRSTSLPGPLVDSLLAQGRASLRATAVRALRPAGRAGELAAYLADPAARVREAARGELRATGQDPLTHYRALCADSPAPGAVFGLAEAGDASDLPLLRLLARAPDGRVRAAAVSGLRRHGATTPEELLPYLADPHPPAARAARSLVVPYARTRPESWLLGLFAPGRPEPVRVAALLLLELRPLLVRRRIARALTSHRDPAVRGRARKLLQQRLRWDEETGRRAALDLAEGTGTPLDEVVDTEDPAAWSALDIGARSMASYGPEALASRSATALCHWDGRIRERAVAEAAGTPELLPLVVLRCADWAPQVRAAARRVVTGALRDAGEDTLRTLTPMVMHLAKRQQGRWAAEAFEAALREPRYAAVRAQLCTHRDLRTRRAAVRITLEAADSFTALDLARRAAGEPDAVLRDLWTRAALAALAARGSEDAAVDALLASRAGFVRAAGVTALRAAGRAGEASRYLADPSGTVRACARWLLRQDGADARAAYLRLCADSPVPGAVLGLAECGERADSAVLTGLLGHRDGPVRAAALAGLRLLDVPGPGPEALLALLDDPSPAVVREATRSLRPVADRVPTGPLVARTLRDRPAHLRRAALRLLAARGADEGLPALTAALDDPDPAARRIALDLLRGWDWQATARRETFEPRELRTLYQQYYFELDWNEMRRTRLIW
ncbi:HEAT repeat domain-containing protein [Streptomyces sp. ZAF1911]|uniref:HEAT repeat domain-containing protein n=1 Tax=Streptomyces sp. ZAF1911 TaxID=2944129 RepID=UPI00237A6CAC|nr:HEAT repeat domain-containing protein [Streptomyces sp. ZAF1911]MDD9382278.1 HEAT repeat domain-containing protein [Streptomyces sp. ZAF1911]